MKIGFETPDFIELRYRPRPRQTNILQILGEFPNRMVETAHICERMGMQRRNLAAYITRLRRLLTPDWTIDRVYSLDRSTRGYRLTDLRDR